MTALEKDKGPQTRSINASNFILPVNKEIPKEEQAIRSLYV